MVELTKYIHVLVRRLPDTKMGLEAGDGKARRALLDEEGLSNLAESGDPRANICIFSLVKWEMGIRKSAGCL